MDCSTCRSPSATGLGKHAGAIHVSPLPAALPDASGNGGEEGLGGRIVDVAAPDLLSAGGFTRRAVQQLRGGAGPSDAQRMAEIAVYRSIIALGQRVQRA